ncbi:MAG TPA: D-alanyl-D-alanine carboxypeptidase family protein [Xanthobacteraceae bacterium]|nr:D-alanyl-D-alanine carboxypeptidase family protein [Xanthobacteraceae bacterium]
MLKQFLWTAAALSLVVAGPAAAQKKDDNLQTSVPHAILIEAESGSILYERAADDLVYPASLAKLMTAEVVFNELQQGKITLEDEVIISENAWRTGGAPSRTSSMFAPLNSRVKVNDLLRGIIIQSGNDACIAIAEALAGNEMAFGVKMTNRAREIGLTKSTFTNSTGLHNPGLKVTARELGKLAQHIIRTYPDFYKIYGEREFTYNKIRQYNRNPLLGWGADGLKTGFTKESGYGLVASAEQNGMRLIVVVMGAKGEKERADEARKLLEWGFRSFEARILFAEGQTVGEAKVFGGEKGYVPLVGSGTIRLMVPRNVSEKIVARVTYTGPLPAPVERGRQAGVLKVWRGDTLALEVPLQTGEEVGAGSLSQRAFDAVTESVITLFRAGAERL